MNITHKQISGGMLNIGHTTKFKTIRIQVVFDNDLTEDTVTKRAILPYLMRSITTKYPSRIALQTKLEDMYAASFYGGVRKLGKTQEISFDLHIIHADYAIDSPDLLTEAFQFLHEVLFRPLFDEAIFAEERRLIEEYFLGLYGDKLRYSVRQMMQAMYQGNEYQLDAMGNPDSLQLVTLADCIDAYHSMITEDGIHINVVGDVSEDDILPLIDTYLSFEPREKTRTIIDYSVTDRESVQVIEEQQQITQAKLVMGYQLPVYYLTDEYYHAVVFNTMFGSGPDSLLFHRIREELNKVYFIGTMYDQYKGSLLLYAGIHSADQDVVMAEIATMIERIIAKDISPEALQIAKTSLVQNLIESMDSINSIVSRIHHLAVFGKTFDQHRLIQTIEQTTMDDIVNIARKLKLDTTFFLRGETDA